MCEVHFLSIEGGHRDVRHMLDRRGQHVAALRRAEQRALLGVVEHGHDQVIEDLRSPCNQVEVPIGHGIEGARVDGFNVLHRRGYQAWSVSAVASARPPPQTSGAVTLTSSMLVSSQRMDLLKT